MGKRGIEREEAAERGFISKTETIEIGHKSKWWKKEVIQKTFISMQWRHDTKQRLKGLQTRYIIFVTSNRHRAHTI